MTDEETLATEDVTSSGEELTAALGVYEQYNYTEPDPADYGVWVPWNSCIGGKWAECYQLWTGCKD